jgi:phytoene desaturase
VASYLKDPRTQRVLSFQSMYAGLSPYDALAIYAVIAYMDSVAGVVFPKGGMHAVPRALAGAAEKHGVSFRYGEQVARVVVENGRATAVETTTGDRLPADVVVLTTDVPQDLLPPTRRRRLTYSPSCFLLLAGSSASYAKTAHHNLHFGRAWRSVFRELIDDGRLMTDPSLLVTNPTASDPALAPAGKQSYYVLVPTPNTDAGIDWDVVGPRYRDEVVARLEGLGYKGFGDAVEVEHVTTPADWQRLGMAHGTPFGPAHTFRQTGPFRPGNLLLDNVVRAGSGTRPGVGVPMVLLSGRLAAERVLGR